MQSVLLVQDSVAMINAIQLISVWILCCVGYKVNARGMFFFRKYCSVIICGTYRPHTLSCGNGWNLPHPAHRPNTGLHRISEVYIHPNPTIGVGINRNDNCAIHKTCRTSPLHIPVNLSSSSNCQSCVPITQSGCHWDAVCTGVPNPTVHTPHVDFLHIVRVSWIVRPQKLLLELESGEPDQYSLI